MGAGEMPKELINDPESSFAVEVNWGRDVGHIQIATVTRPKQGNTPLLLAELVERWDEGTRELATGLFCTLDRRMINELIRMLRRARDQAFGRDE
jgi:hypothetical protein